MSESVFNEGSGDVDFRVEGNTNANLLFIDGGNDRVGVGTNSVSSDATFGVSGNIELKSAGNRYYVPRQSDGAITGSLYSRTGNTITLSGAGSSSGQIEFIPSSANSSAVALTIDSSQNAIFEGELEVKNAASRRISLNYEDSTNSIISHSGTSYGLESLNIRGDSITFYTDYDSGTPKGNVTLTLDNSHNATFAGNLTVNGTGSDIITGDYLYLDAADNSAAKNLVFRQLDDTWLGQIEFHPSSTSQIVTRVNQPLAFGVNNAHKMTIGTDGNVAIGTSSASPYNNNADNLIIYETGDDTGITLVADNDRGSNIYFADAEDDNVGGITYNHNSNYMNFRINGSERMRITSAGDIELGTDETHIHMNTSDGSDNKSWSICGGGGDSTARGAIVHVAGNEDGEDGKLRLYAGNASNNNGMIHFHTGNSVERGKFDYTGDFYTNDGTVSSLASDVRVKDSITDLSDGLSIINQLRPVTFRYTDDSEFHEADDLLVKRYGFIADEVKEVAPQYTEEGKGKVGEEEVDDFKTLSMLKMFPMLVKAVQELSTKVTALEGN